MPTLPSTFARIVVVPTASAAIAPEFDMVATDVLSDDHATVRSVSVAPVDEYTLAVTVPDAPNSSDNAPGKATTDSTVAGVTLTGSDGDDPLQLVTKPSSNAERNNARA